MRQRQAPSEPPEVLRAALPRHLVPREAAVCTCELAKTMLFLRAQLPALFAEMCATVAEPAAAPGADGNGGTLPLARPRRKRVSAVDRRARKTLAAVEALEALLTPAVFADAALESVVLVLGASAARPREAYELRFSAARGGASGSWSEPAGRNAGADAARRATRVLVGALADAPEALGAMKLFVLLRCRADAAVPPGFLPKRGLRPALHRAKVAHTVLIAPADAPAIAPQQPPQLLVTPAPSGGNAVEPVWLQCKVVVRGMPRARASTHGAC